MHDGMPYDQIQGPGHGCLKTTQEESTVSPARDKFSVLELHSCLCNGSIDGLDFIFSSS